VYEYTDQLSNSGYYLYRSFREVAAFQDPLDSHFRGEPVTGFVYVRDLGATD
jgi:hypothetical protein